ncbi:MAG: protein translocase subunit SecF [Polyangiaceae bacterium]|nr:protein translocase subunit SecF [Polyangiaceae bacterium]
MEFFPVGKTLDFMGKRRPFVWLSFLLFLASVVALAVYPGPNLGTDFRGGTEVEVAFTAPVEANDLRRAVTESGFASVDVVRIEATNQQHHYLLRVQEVTGLDEAKRLEIERAMCFGEGVPAETCPAESSPTEVKVSPGGDKITARYATAPDLERIRAQVAGVAGVRLRAGANNPLLQNAREHKVEVLLEGRGDQLMAGLRDRLGPGVVPDAPLRSEWIGPKAGAQLRDAAIRSVLISLVLIMAYIAFRFDLRFAPGAVIGVFHDTIITIGILALLRKEINLTTVAAILTVVGYSTNDSVVVYDRIRENMGKLRGVGFERLLNVSLSETFSRTIITGGPTILSLVAFFVWGTGALKDFALTLIIGVIVGTFSSIYVAVPFTWWLDEKVFKRGASARPTRAPVKRADAVV